MTEKLTIAKGDNASLGNSWKIYKAHFLTFLIIFGLSFLVGFINSIMDFTTAFFINLLGYDAYYEDTSVVAQLISQVAVWLNPITRFFSELIFFLYFLVPILYFNSKEVITPGKLFKAIFKKPGRYLLGGFLFGVLSYFGTLFCLIPGILIGYTYPIYLNKIATTENPVFSSLRISFQNVYKSKSLFAYVGLFTLFFVISNVLTALTCNIGGIILFPLFAIFIQHLAFNKGISK